MQTHISTFITGHHGNILITRLFPLHIIQLCIPGNILVHAPHNLVPLKLLITSIAVKYYGSSFVNSVPIYLFSLHNYYFPTNTTDIKVVVTRPLNGNIVRRTIS